MSSSARPAATVIVLRPSSTGMQVLLLKRSRKAGFFPSAWVFPGGRIDAADSMVPLVNAEGLSEAKMAAVVAAHRECFEEAGVWLGCGQPDPQLRDQLNQRSGSLPTDGSLVVDAQRFRQWSRWVTPDTEPKRYDTWFFVCVLNQEEGEAALSDGVHDGMETVELSWLSIEDAAEAHETGEMFMAPPTYVTLKELSHFSTQEEIWVAAEDRDCRQLQPVHHRNDEGLQIFFPGHPQHPDPSARSQYLGVRLEEGVWHLL